MSEQELLKEIKTMKQTIIIANTIEMFNRWAYGRRINRTRYNRMFIDKDEEYHLVLLSDRIDRVLDTISGRLFDEIEDISTPPHKVREVNHYRNIKDKVYSRLK